MQRQHGSAGRKTQGNVRDKLLAKDVQDFLTVRMALNKKVDRTSVAAFALAESAFAPASQATPFLASSRVPWETRRDQWGDEEFVQLFRFSRSEVDTMLPLFNIQANDTHVLRNKSVFTREESFLTTLRRLAHADTLQMVGRDMQRQGPHVSDAFNDTIDYLYDNFARPLLTSRMLMWADRAPVYADAIRRKTGVPVDTIAYVDGTTLEHCRPSYGQRACWDGHHRSHDLLFQGLKAPDGLTLNLEGPWEGRHHDAYMTCVTGLDEQLEELHRATEVPYTVYGDPAYIGFPPYLLYGFKNIPSTTAQQLRWAQDMNVGRICVEWGFGRVEKMWQKITEKRALKVFGSPIAKYFFVATLLTNCHTCIHGDQTSSYFACTPPTIEDYLGRASQ